jgi:hypothetical protein
VLLGHAVQSARGADERQGLVCRPGGCGLRFVTSVPTHGVDVQVGLCDVCVLSLKEKCGRRLLSIATEITFQVRATSGEHAREIVRELKSQALDNMMLQANIRYYY